MTDGVLICDWGGNEYIRFVPDSLPHVSVLVPHEKCASVLADDYRGWRRSIFSP